MGVYVVPAVHKKAYFVGLCMYVCSWYFVYLFMMLISLPALGLLFRKKLYSAVVGKGRGTCGTLILGFWGFILVRLLLKFPGQFRHNFNSKIGILVAPRKLLKNLQHIL
jgi:hypothetical protein